MTATLAKAFITLIFVLTSIFLGLAISETTNADDNPKYEYLKVVAQRDMVSFDIRRLTTDIEREMGTSGGDGEAGEPGQIASATEWLEDRRDELVQSTADNVEEASGYRRGVTDQLQTLQDVAMQVSDFTATIKAYREAIASYERKSANLQDMYQDVIRQYESLAIEKMRMQIESERLDEDGRSMSEAYIAAQRETQQLTEIIRAVVAQNPWVPDIARGAGRYVEGRITEVTTDTGLVVIDKGGRDEVRVGMHFSIFRGPDFIGKVEITIVQPQYSIGLLVPPFESARVQVGDTVKRSQIFYREGR